MTEFKPRHQAQTERELRKQLAAAYRIFDHLGWTALTTIYGHITVRVPGPDRHFLINPFGLRYDEVTASNLVKIDLDGNIVGQGSHPVNPAGFIIHGAIHAARSDAHCVMHTHTLAGMAMAATGVPIGSYDFAGASLIDRVAYHDFGGVHADFSDREALVHNLGDKSVMLMRNHGLLSCGPTVASAFRRLFALETACQVQSKALAMNVPLVQPPAAVAQTHAQVLDEADDGEMMFAALYRLMEQRDPSFLN
jgi:ribulose-5-phosphate 4-epimerase/fuculose-1-phosphate aldolase